MCVCVCGIFTIKNLCTSEINGCVCSVMNSLHKMVIFTMTMIIDCTLHFIAASIVIIFVVQSYTLCLQKQSNQLEAKHPTAS